MNLNVREVDRDWKTSKERGYKAISFSLREKPESTILLVEDVDYESSFDYHICFGENLCEDEFKFLANVVLNFMQPGWYLLTSGESNPEKEKLYNYFLYSGRTEDTDCLRVLKTIDGETKYYKILRKK